VLGVPQETVNRRHYSITHDPEPIDRRSRLVEPTHMRVAGGEEAISPGLARVVVYRQAQQWQCLIETPTAEMGDADARRQTSNPRSGIEAP
jgi:hypothetical protein